MSPRSHQQYSQHVRLYLNPVLGRFQLSKHGAQQVQGFLDWQIRSDLSARTVQLSHVILKHAL